jgi:hypothetical protein
MQKPETLKTKMSRSVKTRTIYEEQEDELYPPSNPKSKGSKSKKRRGSGSQLKTLVRAFLFPADKPDPIIIEVPCTTISHPASFEGPYHRANYKSTLGKVATFKTVETYRGMFFLIQPDEEEAELTLSRLTMNRCVYEVTGGVSQDWMGDVVVLKEIEPKSEKLGDVDPSDLDVLIEYFRLHGNAPGAIHFTSAAA